MGNHFLLTPERFHFLLDLLNEVTELESAISMEVSRWRRRAFKAKSWNLIYFARESR